MLAATYSSWLHHFVPEQDFFDLLHRTIKFMHNLAPLSPIFGVHAKVLEEASRTCEDFRANMAGQSTPQSYGAELPPPRTSRVGSIPGAAVGSASAHSSFSSSR